MDSPDGTQATPVAETLAPPPVPQLSFGGYVELGNTLIGVGFRRRAAARIIDHLIHYLCAWLSGTLFGLLLLSAALISGVPVQQYLAKLRGINGFWSLLLGLLGFFAYTTIMEAMHGSTVGKRILGMTVVREDGTPSGWKAAAIRSAAYYIDGLFFGMVAYFAMKHDDFNQRHGDDWAGTLVCERKEIRPENLRGAAVFAGALIIACLADMMILISAVLIKLF